MKMVSKKQKQWEQKKRKRRIKKITLWSIISIFFIIFILWINNASTNYSNFENPEVSSNQVPTSQIHWHPQLTIKMNGKEITIDDNIGLGPRRHSPTHTHNEGDGTIHLENMNPSAQPETMTLGYFFNQWRKPFNQTCLLDKCTDIDGGEIRMYVNGEENFEFENYIFKGEDKILIEYNN